MQKKKNSLFLAIIITLLIISLISLYWYQQIAATESDKQQTTLSDAVGQAYKSPRDQSKAKILPAYDESKKKILLTEEQKMQYNDPVKYSACVEAKKISKWTDKSFNQNTNMKLGEYKGCYDPTGDDLKVASAVYYFDFFSQPTYKAYSYKEVSISECKFLADKCKGEKTPFIIEAYCDQKGNPTYTEAKDCRVIFGNNDYVCDKGKCVLNVDIKKKPDLVVDIIYKDVYGKQCVNSYHFKICNNGDAPLEKQFAMTVKANGYESKFNYLFADFPKLKPKECVDIIKPDKLTILKFSTSVQTTNDVNVVLDTNNEIDELDEKNNDKTASVYSGNGYIYDPATYDPNKEETWCDTFCYDSDDGKNFDKIGKVLFKYNSYISTADDHCWGNNEVKTILNEAYCKKIVKYENTGKFSNPLGWKDFDCTILNTDEQQYKCEKNQCVPCIGGKCWYATNGVPSGKDDICKEIVTDNGNSEDNNKGTNEPQADPFVKGNNDICSDSTSLKDGDEPPIDKDTLPQDELKAYCAATGEEIGSSGSSGSSGSEEMSDFEKWLKDLYGDYVPEEPTYYDCSYYSTADQAYACIDGKCIGIDESQNKEACVGPKETEIDAYQKNKITYTTILGDKQEEQSDWCIDYGDKVINVFCNEKKLNTKEYSCVKDGAACVDGKCVMPDESKKKCVEKYDIGIAYETLGIIEYTTEYDQSDVRGDYCINGDQLIEYYCEGKQNKFTDPFSCNSLGKKCVDGSCQ
ncbi:hypothetical protein HZA96_00885 [Candidatus Woesearchaeota archaeon]|nr:hypothetical protein [Candidatus Woesearchaeota archaeon]